MSDPVRESGCPLVIGVSGHRDIHSEHVGRITGAVGAFLAALRGQLPDTGISIMVGMASGADLLVAQAAVELQLPVDAVLPMRLSDYERDFNPESLERLRRLLAHPLVRTVELMPPAAGDGRVLDASSVEDRDHFYVNLTDCLIRKSNLLIALWDGQVSVLPGGTGDTVLRYLGARTDVRLDADIDFVDAAGESAWGHQFVYWVPTPRQGVPHALSATEPCFLSAVGEHLLQRQRDMPGELRHQLYELDDYNREFAGLSKRTDFRGPDSLLGSAPDDIPESERQLLAQIDREYGRSDALAVFYQRHSDRLFKGFSLMAFSMGFLFLVYAKLFDSGVFLTGYLVILLLGLVIFQLIKRRHWFSRHLVYRALAETMRTKFFLRVAAADRGVNAADLIELTGIDQFAGFSWITNVLKNVDPFDEPAVPPPDQQRRRLEAVRQAWIDGQEKYFRTRVHRLGHTHHKLERMKVLMFYALGVIGTVLVLWATPLKSVTLAGSVTPKDILMFLMGLLPVGFGIWELYQGKMATRELLWQYRNQLNHFLRASLQLARDAAPARQAAVLADLGRRSLMESYLWTIHRYHREHEPPAAG